MEKRAHVDETRFLVNLHDIGVAGGAQVRRCLAYGKPQLIVFCFYSQRRRSMQPKQMRTMTLGQLDNGEPAEISVRADSSFTSEEPSTSGSCLLITGAAITNLPNIQVLS